MTSSTATAHNGLDRQSGLEVVRDLVLDRTALLQKVVGESSPGEILKQLAEIDQTEKRLRSIAAMGRGVMEPAVRGLSFLRHPSSGHGREWVVTENR